MREIEMKILDRYLDRSGKVKRDRPDSSLALIPQRQPEIHDHDKGNSQPEELRRNGGSHEPGTITGLQALPQFSAGRSQTRPSELRAETVKLLLRSIPLAELAIPRTPAASVRGPLMQFIRRLIQTISSNL
jgi:hypothetical protein